MIESMGLFGAINYQKVFRSNNHLLANEDDVRSLIFRDMKVTHNDIVENIRVKQQESVEVTEEDQEHEQDHESTDGGGEISLYLNSCEVDTDVMLSLLEIVFFKNDGDNGDSITFCAIQSPSLNCTVASGSDGHSLSRSLITLGNKINDDDNKANTMTTKNMNMMRCLDFSFCSLGPRALQSLGTVLHNSLTKLETLCLDGNTHINQVSLRKLFKCFVQKHPSLRRISLSSCDLNDDCMNVILKNNNITHLDLSSNKFTSESIHVILSALQNGGDEEKGGGGKYRLEALDLSYNKLGDEGIRILTHGLNSGRFPNLRELYLRETGASESVVALLDAVAKSNITCLDVSGNDFIGNQKKGSYSSPKNFAAAAIKKFNVESKVQSFLQHSNSIYGSSGGITSSLSTKEKQNSIQRTRSLKALSKLLASSSSPLSTLGCDRVGLEDKDCTKLYSILKKMKMKAKSKDIQTSDGLKSEDILTLTVNLNAGISSEGLLVLDRALDVAASLRENGTD